MDTFTQTAQRFSFICGKTFNDQTKLIMEKKKNFETFKTVDRKIQDKEKYLYFYILKPRRENNVNGTGLSSTVANKSCATP